MLEQVLRYLNNYFVKSWSSGVSCAVDSVTVVDASDFIKGQYVHIRKSLLNDGVYKISEINGNVLTIDGELSDETNDDMIVYGLAIPPGVLSIVTEIETMSAANPNGLVQERLGDYSVTYGYSDSASWISRYGTRLAQWRRVYLTFP